MKTKEEARRISTLKNRLINMRRASIRGRLADGQPIRVRIRGTMRRPDAVAEAEAAAAAAVGLDLKLFTGYLDSVFFSSAGHLCFTMLVLERINAQGRYCYRTFNVDSGLVDSVDWLIEA